MNIKLRIQLLTSGVGTVANLARRTGIERTRLHRAMNGDLRLRDEEKVAVAKALHASVDELSVWLLIGR